MTRTRIVALLLLGGLVVAAAATRGFGLFDRQGLGLTLYGNVDIRQVDLGFRVPGRIAAMPYDEGQMVAAGAVLARLDPRPLDDQLANARAKLAQAEAELARSRNGNRPQDISRAEAQVSEQRALMTRAKADFDRRSQLLPSGAVSQAVVTNTEGEYRAALARLQAAEDALALLRAGSRKEDLALAAARQQAAAAEAAAALTDVEDAMLRAPEAGTVLTRAREPGAIAKAGETVMTLTIDRPVRIRAFIDQGDLWRIAPGMKVLVTADGNPRRYQGAIGFISPTAEFTPKSVQTESLRTDLVFRLRINIADADGALRQGQPVTIAVPDARSRRP